MSHLIFETDLVKHFEPKFTVEYGNERKKKDFCKSILLPWQLYIFPPKNIF